VGNRTIGLPDHEFSSPNLATGFDWYSQGIVLRPGRLGSIVEVKRIKGPIFSSKEEAEQHGLQLCKDWIDNRLPQ
jgi:hypothetical protein